MDGPGAGGAARPGARIERFDEGDAWVIEGVNDPINFGMNACAGLAPEEMKGWGRFEDIRHGGYDPAARLDEMDADGVDAEVLYPTPRLSQAIFANPDVDYHLAMVRGLQRLAVGVRRVRARALRRARAAAQRRRRGCASPRSTACSTVPGCGAW